jgi:hypothetical protein
MKGILSLLAFLCITLQSFSQTPKLNSFPQAIATVFLDFDGQTVRGTAWNWDGPIQAASSGFSAEAITQIFNHVAEDYRIFNINITTDSTVFFAAPALRRIRVIVTPTWEWYAKKVGGISYVNSMKWADDTPAWVFSGLLGNNIKSVADCISHEAGHVLGLQHQSVWDAACVKIKEYAEGKGTGQIGWGPLMGVSYDKNLSTWHTGTSAKSCTTPQNDIEVIAKNVGLRADEHTASLSDATPISMMGSEFAATGVINTEEDRDVFSFQVHAPARFRIHANPQSTGPANEGANLDIKVSLLNNLGDTVGRYNPAELLNAGVDSVLQTGLYYLVVDGVGNTNLRDYASLGYYAVTGSIAQALPVTRFHLTGRASNGQHIFNWVYDTDEAIKTINIQYSADGVHFSNLVEAGVDTKQFSWKPGTQARMYYRAQAITVADERAYYSNIVTLQPSASAAVKLHSNLISDAIGLTTGKAYMYQLLDAAGRLLQQGKVSAGYSRIEVRGAPAGILLLRLQAENEVHSEKLIKQ